MRQGVRGGGVGGGGELPRPAEFIKPAMLDTRQFVVLVLEAGVPETIRRVGYTNPRLGDGNIVTLSDETAPEGDAVVGVASFSGGEVCVHVGPKVRPDDFRVYFGRAVEGGYEFDLSELPAEDKVLGLMGLSAKSSVSAGGLTVNFGKAALGGFLAHSVHSDDGEEMRVAVDSGGSIRLKIPPEDDVPAGWGLPYIQDMIPPSEESLRRGYMESGFRVRVHSQDAAILEAKMGLDAVRDQILRAFLDARSAHSDYIPVQPDEIIDVDFQSGRCPQNHGNSHMSGGMPHLQSGVQFAFHGTVGDWRVDPDSYAYSVGEHGIDFNPAALDSTVKTNTAKAYWRGKDLGKFAAAGKGVGAVLYWMPYAIPGGDVKSEANASLLEFDAQLNMVDMAGGMKQSLERVVCESADSAGAKRRVGEFLLGLRPRKIPPEWLLAKEAFWGELRDKIYGILGGFGITIGLEPFLMEEPAEEIKRLCGVGHDPYRALGLKPYDRQVAMADVENDKRRTTLVDLCSASSSYDEFISKIKAESADPLLAGAAGEVIKRFRGVFEFNPRDPRFVGVVAGTISGEYRRVLLGAVAGEELKRRGLYDMMRGIVFDYAELLTYLFIGEKRLPAEEKLTREQKERLNRESGRIRAVEELLERRLLESPIAYIGPDGVRYPTQLAWLTSYDTLKAVAEGRLALDGEGNPVQGHI